jgi:hypothetical protein
VCSWTSKIPSWSWLLILEQKVCKKKVKKKNKKFCAVCIYVYSTLVTKGAALFIERVPITTGRLHGLPLDEGVWQKVSSVPSSSVTVNEALLGGEQC